MSNAQFASETGIASLFGHFKPIVLFYVMMFSIAYDSH